MAATARGATSECGLAKRWGNIGSNTNQKDPKSVLASLRTVVSDGCGIDGVKS